jgi:hypothetical protein
MKVLLTIPKTAQRSPMDGRDGKADGFLLSTNCSVLLQTSSAYVNQPKPLVTTESYHVVNTTYICMNRMIR